MASVLTTWLYREQAGRVRNSDMEGSQLLVKSFQASNEENWVCLYLVLSFHLWQSVGILA